MGAEVAAVAAPAVEDLLFPAISESLIGGGVEAASAGFAAGASPLADVALSGGISEAAADAAAKAGIADAASAAGTAGAAASGAGAESAREKLKDAASVAKDAATILSPAASLFGASKSISAAKQIGATGYPPPVSPLVPMPSVGGPNTIIGQRASVQEQLRRRGRAATILTDSGSGEKLGS